MNDKKIDLEDKFFEQNKENLPKKQKRSLEEAFERALWDKKDEPEIDEPEWL